MLQKQCKNHTKPERGFIAPRVGFIARMERISFNEAVSEEGLFAGQHQIIMVLKTKGNMTISQLAKELNIAPSTVSVSIKRLEKAGFVTKKVNKSDARITEIHLTKKGEAAPEHIKQKMESEENMLTAGLSQEEKYLLSDLLDKIIENFIEKEESKKC